MIQGEDGKLRSALTNVSTDDVVLVQPKKSSVRDGIMAEHGIPCISWLCYYAKDQPA